MNEREVEHAKTICSVSGRPCRCESNEGCTRNRGRSYLDSDAGEALRWARTAMLRLGDAANALELAVDALVYERPFPSPEWRDKVRRINRLIEELEEEVKQ